MPFDGNETAFKPDADPSCAPDFQSPRERGLQLARELRNLPEWWGWDFDTWGGDCGTNGCAYGWACHRWPELRAISSCGPEGKHLDVNAICQFVGLNPSECGIFLSADYYRASSYRQVTPAMVADALEAALGEGYGG